MIWKVMIVDDDRNFRYAMKDVIPWEQNGFHVVKEAVHGMEAWQYLEKNPCDIVLTDMEMPGMNGVELTGKIKEAFPDMIVIALSAYDDFGFVRDSMRLGAADYILKQEFDPDQIIKKIKNLCAAYQSERRRALSHSESQRELLSYLRKERSGISEENEFYSLHDVERMTLTLVCGTDKTAPTQNGIDSFGVSKDPDVELFARIKEGEWIFVCSFLRTVSEAQMHRKQSAMISLIRAGFSEPVYLALSDEYGDFSTLPNQYAKAEQVIVNRIYSPEQRVFHFADFRTQKRIRDYKWKEKSQEKLPEDGIRKEIEEFSAEMRKAKPDEQILNQNFSLFCENLCKRLQISRDDETTIRYYEEVCKRNSLAEKADFSREYTENELQSKKSGYNGTHPVIQELISFVRAHFTEDITLADVAELTGLSENYISNLFKKEMGENLTHYINKLRIENAQYLLEHSDLRVYEIAERCGFHNSAYFTTTFRKFTGMSLSEYRKAHVNR